MIRKLTVLSLLLSLVLPHNSFAVEVQNKPVQCSNPEEFFQLIAKYEEKPIAIMNGIVMGTNGQYMKAQTLIFYNKETTSWTLVEYLSEEQVCILGTGKGLELLVDTGVKT